jgi:hypothetical protein
LTTQVSRGNVRPGGELDLFHLISAALFAHAARSLPPDAPEQRLLGKAQVQLDRASIEAALLREDPRTRRVRTVAQRLSLTPVEVAALVLALAVEQDLLAGRVLASLQAPVGGSRPTLGFLEGLLSGAGAADPASLVAGAAVGTGLLERISPDRPLPEQSLAVPTPLVLALSGQALPPPGVRCEREPLPLPSSVQARAAELARGMEDLLVIRASHPREALAAACCLAVLLGGEPAITELDPDRVPGFGPWLHLTGAVPVLVRRLAPGERLGVRRPAGWAGPLLVCTGPDGVVTGPRGAVPSWKIGTPPRPEREHLWHEALGPEGAVPPYRHGIARIDELGRLARHRARCDGRSEPEPDDLRQAGLDGDAGGLGAHAQLLPEPIPDEALVLPQRIRDELELVLTRCRLREEYTAELGLSARTRGKVGVHNLFLGPPGTGKTLAAGWLASRLGLPLYRVDLASVVSKYIGETERNLAELLALAESAEVVLLFDEADSLFGQRTEVRHSTDRYANAQTNYLLQRIESYDGIVVLSSNSRERFDDALARRLDAVVEFPLPAPVERRALWVAHLGRGHVLSHPDLNRLATHCDLAGGHIRNIVLTAAVQARAAERRIEWPDLERALSLEYRKIGKAMPHGLRASP